MPEQKFSLSFPGCSSCLAKPCDRLRFGRVFPGKFLLVHKRYCDASHWDCPFVAKDFEEVRSLASNDSLIDLAAPVEDILFQLSIQEQLSLRQEHFVTVYNDIEGRLRYLEALWNADALTVIRVPLNFTADKSLARWLLANETLAYQFEQKKQEEDAGPAVTDGVAQLQTQSQLAAAPPKEKQTITDIEVWVEGEAGPRKVTSDGTLEIVPDLVVGRKITCKEVKGLDVSWAMEGYQSETRNGSEATFQVKGWPKVTNWPWFSRERPKPCTVTAKDGNGNALSARVNIFTGTQEITEIDYLKSPFFSSIQEAFEKLDKLLIDLTGKGIEIRFLYGKIGYSAGFKEDHKNVAAFWGYDFSAGLNPLFSIKLIQDFDLTAIIPPAIRKYAPSLKFELAIGGEWNLNGHYAKTGPDESEPSLNSELRILFECTGGAEITKSLFGNSEYKVIDAKLGGATGVTGDFEPLSNKKGLGVCAKMKFDGIKISGYISALDGLFTYKKEIALIEEKILMPKKELYIVGEHDPETNG